MAALLVPQGLRADWQQEWIAEISSKRAVHLTWGGADAMTQARLLYRSMGSFIDAIILRWDFLLSPAATSPAALVDRQPVFLGMAVFVLLTLCGYFVDPWIRSLDEYFRFYFVMDAMLGLALFGTLFLLYRCALLGGTRTWRGVRLILGGWLLMTCLIPPVVYWDSPQRYWLWIARSGEGVCWSSILLTVLLLIFVKKLDSATDLALPLYGVLIVLIPRVGALTTRYLFLHHYDLYHRFLLTWLGRLSDGCTILAFVLWGYAWTRRTRRCSTAR